MMKKLLAMLVALLTLSSANCAFAFSKEGMRATDPEQFGAKSISLEKYNDILTVYSILSGRDNTLEAYTITYAADHWELEPFASFTESGNNYREAPVPSSPAVLADPAGDCPRLKLNGKEIALTEGAANKRAYQIFTGLEAYRDYLSNPEEYPGFEGNPFLDRDRRQELTSAYTAIRSNETHARRNQKARVYEGNNRRAIVALSVLLILIIVCFVVKVRTSGAKMAAGFDANIRRIALAGTAALVAAGVSVAMLGQTTWPVIVAAVFLILVLEAVLFFQGIDVIDHLKFAGRGKFPWLPAIVFSLVSLMSLSAIIFVIAVLSSGARLTVPLSKEIPGFAISLVLIALTGWWYFRSLTRNAPFLRRSFIWIALATLLLAQAVVVLILIIIGAVIFRGTGRMFFSDSQDNSGSSGSSVGHDCGRCHNNGVAGRCSIYGDYDHPVFNCPHYNPVR